MGIKTNFPFIFDNFSQPFQSTLHLKFDENITLGTLALTNVTAGQHIGQPKDNISLLTNLSLLIALILRGNNKILLIVRFLFLYTFLLPLIS